MKDKLKHWVLNKCFQIMFICLERKKKRKAPSRILAKGHFKKYHKPKKKKKTPTKKYSTKERKKHKLAVNAKIS